MCVKNLRENVPAKLHTQRVPDGVFSTTSGLSLREAVGMRRGMKDVLNSAGPTTWVWHRYSGRSYNQFFYENF